MINVVDKLSWVVIHNEWRPEWEFIARSKGIQYRSEADEYFTTFWGNDQALLEQISREAIQMKDDNLWVESHPLPKDEWHNPEFHVENPFELYPVGSMVYIKPKKAYGRVVIISDEPKLYSVDTGFTMSSGTYTEDELALAPVINSKSSDWVTQEKSNLVTNLLQTAGFTLLTGLSCVYLWTLFPEHFTRLIEFFDLIGV